MTSRYEREIEELLKRMGGHLRREPLVSRFRRRLVRLEALLYGIWRAFLRRSPIEQFMLAGVVLALLSYLLHPLSAKVAFYTGIVSLVLFVLAITISVVSHGTSSLGGHKGWRGRSIDYGSSGPGWWLQLRRWWRWRRRLF